MMSTAPNRERVVWVVEDDADIRTLLGLYLEFRGCEVVLAANGKEALARLQDAERLPDLLLVDLWMPHMNGFELRAALEHDPELAAIPIVILSADAQLVSHASALRIAGFLKKPIRPDALLDVIDRLCPTAAAG
jgi:CheY-like chemotaxis protein